MHDAEHEHIHVHEYEGEHEHSNEGLVHTHTHDHGDGVVHTHTHSHEGDTGFTHTHTHDGDEHTHIHTHEDGTVHSHTHSHGDGGHTHSHGHGPHGHVHTDEEKKAVINRISKAVGHMEHVKKMVAAGEDCSDVLIQLAAVRSAINAVGRIVLVNHIDHCVVEAIEAGDTETLDKLEEAIRIFIK